MMRHPTHGPATLPRPPIANPFLLPANLLTVARHSRHWTDRLPHPSVLIVLPSRSGAVRTTLLAAARLLAARGYQVSILPAELLS